MKRKLIIILVFLSAMPWTFAAGQKLYKWVDADGKVSYHDQPPPEGSNIQVEEKRIGLRTSDDVASDAAQKFPVVLYAVPKCASCDLARIYFQKNKIPFSEKNVEKDVKNQQELKDKAGSVSVPTILIGKKVMNGYLESLLEGELKQAGYIIGSAGPADAGKTEDASPSEGDGYHAPTE